MAKRTIEMLADEAIEALPAKVSLVYVDYRDELTDKQVAALVEGDTDSLYESIDEWAMENRADGRAEVAQEVVREVLARWGREDGADYSALEADFDMSDERERLHEAINERDDSDPVADLARQSRDVLLRISVLDEDHGWSFQDIHPEDALIAVGLPITDHNIEVMAATLAECSPEFSVLLGFWIVGASVKTLYDIPSEAREIEIEDPYLYLGNPFAGSGWISENQFEGTVRVKREDLRTDKSAFGHSVSEVYGGLDAARFHCEMRPVEN